MNQIVVLGLIEMRMSIMRGFSSACCPSGVPDPNVTAFMILEGLANYLLDAFLLLFDGVLGYSCLERLRRVFGEADDPCTVISPVLKQLNALGYHYFCVVRSGNNANNATAVCFSLHHERPKGESES